MHLKPKTCAQRIHLILIRVPRGIIFTQWPMYQLRSDSGRGQMCPQRSVTWLSPGSTLPSLIQAAGGTADGGERQLAGL